MRIGEGEFDELHPRRPATDGAQRHRDRRPAFSNLAPDTAWDELHLLYFTGYAMWNYLSTPYVLTWPGVECDEIEPTSENGETWRLRVTFPPDVPTHKREQVLHIDAPG